jgi:carbonic anhydrase/acetyltransferase-like protein (isoleucine patch superfamily)
LLHKYEKSYPLVDPDTYIAPGAQLIGKIVLKQHSSIWFNAVIRADNDKVLIGKGANVQDGPFSFQIICDLICRNDLF